MTEKVKEMSLKEFQELGFVQELNRQFLHPRGLALSIVVTEEGNYIFGGILDARDDIEGWEFSNLDPKVAQEKADRVEQEYRKRLKIRNKHFKSRKGIQSIDHGSKPSTD